MALAWPSSLLLLHSYSKQGLTWWPIKTFLFFLEQRACIGSLFQIGTAAFRCRASGLQSSSIHTTHTHIHIYSHIHAYSKHIIYNSNSPILSTTPSPWMKQCHWSTQYVLQLGHLFSYLDAPMLSLSPWWVYSALDGNPSGPRKADWGQKGRWDIGSEPSGTLIHPILVSTLFRPLLPLMDGWKERSQFQS